MTNNDWMLDVSSTDKQVLKNLADMGAHLKKLRLNMIKAEDAFNDAKKEYEHYAGELLPVAMHNAGISALELAEGGMLKLERKYFCTPNKNEADKAKIAAWLRAHGGEHLIKERAAVDAERIDDLKAAQIPFVEISDFNTNSLKAFVKDLIGANGGTVQVSPEEIPPEMHFTEQGVVTIELEH